MEKYAYTYNDSEPYKYSGKVKRDIDERASKRLGKTIWFMPGNATELEPLPEKEGYDVVFNKDTKHWEYKEIKKEEEPKPYEPTELEKAQEEVWKLESELQSTDYKAIKYAEGYYTEAEYAPIKLSRQYLRNKINDARDKVALLEKISI